MAVSSGDGTLPSESIVSGKSDASFTGQLSVTDSSSLLRQGQRWSTGEAGLQAESASSSGIVILDTSDSNQEDVSEMCVDKGDSEERKEYDVIEESGQEENESNDVGEEYQKVEFAVLYYHKNSGYYYDPVSKW